MSRKKVLVLGGNFGGLTSALAVSHELHGDVDVRVVSASDRFLFNPSLIWLPFGKRRPADITFPSPRRSRLTGSISCTPRPPRSTWRPGR
jgi:sulfide:quinone oxidoreductase